MSFNKFEHAAIAVAISGSGIKRRRGALFKVGAVLVRKNTIIAASCNSKKTHPRLIRFTKYPHLHAESRVIFGCKWKDLQPTSNLKLYVARIHKDQTLALAKPCIVCQAIIRETNIKEVYYSTNEGTFLKLDLTLDC